MTLKIGTDGFGRTRQLVFRTALEDPAAKAVGINDLFIHADYMAHMLTYDPVHRRLKGSTGAIRSRVPIDDRAVDIYTAKRSPDIP